MLSIKELTVGIEEEQSALQKRLLHGVTLDIKPGEIHVIMGPNGAGKSTLAKVLAGHPSYEVNSGEVHLLEKNILDLDPDERAHLGLFVSFQYPVEVAGVTNIQFLQTALNAQRETKLSKEEVEVLMKEKMTQLDIKSEFITRDLNSDYSGGEKKRNEILQMLLLDPKMVVLDETDSGLDIDALKIVAKGVNSFMSKDKGLLLITHYQRLLDYIKPDVVHVMSNGRIIKTGGPELAVKLEKEGYEWLEMSHARVV